MVYSSPGERKLTGSCPLGCDSHVRYRVDVFMGHALTDLIPICFPFVLSTD